MPRPIASVLKSQRQFPAGWLVRTALIVSIGLFLFMILETLAYLRTLAGGLAAFDTRPGGYDVDAARALLEDGSITRGFSSGSIPSIWQLTLLAWPADSLVCGAGTCFVPRH